MFVTDLAKSEELTILQKFKGYFKAPIVILLNNIISYAIFLLLFSCLILFGFVPEKIELLEILVSIWVTAFAVEEFQQVRNHESILFKNNYYICN